MRLPLLLLTILCTLSVSAQEAWTQLNNFPFETYTSSSFVVNDEAYIVVSEESGVDDIIYKYDVNNDIWMMVATIPEETFFLADPFVIGTRVFFVGLGSEIDASIELWEYVPVTNSFEERTGYDFNDFGLYGYDAITFSIGNIGYVLTSASAFDDNVNFVAYDPTTDSWDSKSNYPSDISGDSRSFSINNKGYVSFSMDVGSEGNFINDLWEYDPDIDSWTEKTTYPLSYVTGPVSFVLDDLAYFASGFINDTVYRYSPVENSWELIESPGIFFYNSFGFAINGIGYIGLGSIDDLGLEASDQIWRMDPGLLSITERNTIDVSIFPNPVTDILYLQSNTAIKEVTMYTLLGQEIMTSTIENNQLDLSFLSGGIYLIKITNDRGELTQKLIKT